MPNDDYVIRDGLVSDLEAIRPLWSALYKHEAECGMSYALKPDADAIWCKEMGQRVKSRSTFFFVAEHRAEKSIGAFLAGGIRRRPAIYQISKVGTATELFVEPSARGHGLAGRLVERAAGYLREQNISVFDMMAVSGNEASNAFWKKMGWVDELVQYRYDL